ncbi:Protein RETICULATA-RELATED 5, chloroplastic [Dionaea muscipula]
MKPHIQRGFDHRPQLTTPPCRLYISPVKDLRQCLSPGNHVADQVSTIGRRRRTIFSVHSRHNPAGKSEDAPEFRRTRREVLMGPLLAVGACLLESAVVRAEETPPQNSPPSPPPPPPTPPPPSSAPLKAVVKEEENIGWRIYDATAIGEPFAVGKDKSKVWEKMMNAKIVYLGEAEQVPTRDDKVLELEIVKSLRRRCSESDRSISLALEAFPSDLQEQLNQFMSGRIDGDTLKSYTSHWPPERWLDYEPLLNYCRDNGVRLTACGTPLQILRTVQAEGLSGLSKADRKKYAPPAGSGFISGINPLSRSLPIDINSSNQTITFGPSSYLTVQARVVEDYSMSQIILQASADAGASSLVVVVTGASHIMYGSRGTGLPARISRKMQKKNQVVVLLDPERQFIRREGEVPVADFLWYSAARPCNRNCFDRAEIARVMNAAGRSRDALPQDIQKGLDLGLVSPEVLQNFFDLEQYPLISELTHRFQGFRERLLADPKFLHRLAIEEAISITTTLLAQYERRKENFFQELDYVITDSLRGAVVDFFTVWLPAPTLSFLTFGDEIDMPNSVDSLMGLLGSIPDNAFQKNPVGKNWNLSHRAASVLVGGLKLASVGFISSIGAVASSNALFAVRRYLNPAVASMQKYKRSPIFKTAVVYACFLGTSANLRYQFIAGIVEHRISELLPSETILVNTLSFVVRIINSYWGTQQWVDLARYTGLQTRKIESTLISSELADHSTMERKSPEEANIDDVTN